MPDPEKPNSGEQSSTATAPVEPTGTQRDTTKPSGWEGEFDAPRAARTIENLRKFEERAKELEKENQKLQDAKLSESERTVAERDREKARADAAESQLARFSVAAKTGLPVRFAERLVGNTPDELEADAKKLMEEFRIEAIDGSSGGGGNGSSTDFDAGVRPSRQKSGSMDDMIRIATGRMPVPRQ